MAAATVFCFLFLDRVFEFVALDVEMLTVLVAVFLMTPTVFFGFQRLFDWGDILYDKANAWWQSRKPLGK